MKAKAILLTVVLLLFGLVGTATGTHTVFNGSYQNGWGGISTTDFGGATVVNASTTGTWVWKGMYASSGQNLSAESYWEWDIYCASSGSGDQIAFFFVSPAGQEWNETYKFSGTALIDGVSRSLPYTLSTDAWHTVKIDMAAKSWWSSASSTIQYLKWQFPEQGTYYMRNIRFTGGNGAPQVDAGNNTSITLPTNTVSLDGTVSDDGLPDPPAAVTVTWTKQSGDGTVTFANANAVDTTATFSTDDIYVLRLTASDSGLQNYDEVTVTVNPQPGDGPPVSNITTNASSYPNSEIPAYSKLEITFDVDTNASNLYLPYDSSPPTGITPNIGISVKGQFTPDNWTTTYDQPGFYYQYFDHQIKSSKDWIYPQDNYAWKVRFAPPAAGAWKFRIVAQDASGIRTSTDYNFTVISSDNPGFIRVSDTDERYFEYENGEPFYGLGYNFVFGNLSWDEPSAGESLLQTVSGYGMNYFRLWINNWGIYGGVSGAWNSPDPALHGQYYPYQALTMEVTTPEIDSDVCMKLRYDACPVMWLGHMKKSPAVKQNTNYSIFVEYRIDTALTGPRSGSGSYGLVCKTSQWNDYLYNSGQGTVVSNYAYQATSGWTTLTGSFNSGSNDWIPGGHFSLCLENVNTGAVVYINRVEIRENLGGGQYGPNIINHEWMSKHLYFDQKYSYAFDKVLELAEDYDAHFQLCLMEKNCWIMNRINDSGVNDPSNPSNNYFYGYWTAMTKNRWLQQAFWRWCQARWGYSTSIGTWELLNEGDPWHGRHWTHTDEFGKYMQQFTPNHHITSTSTWGGFPDTEFWGNDAEYPDVDYADLHFYPSTCPDIAAQINNDSTTYGAKQSSGAGKPLVLGETGYYNMVNLENDTNRIWYHNYIWANTNHGGMYQQYWCEEGEFGWTPDPRAHNKPYANFIDGIPLNNGCYVALSPTINGTNIRVLGQKDLTNENAHLWIQNDRHTWYNIVNSNPIGSSTGTIEISGFTPSATYTLEWWDPYEPVLANQIISTTQVSANGSGVITLSVSSLVDDIAAKIIAPAGGVSYTVFDNGFQDNWAAGSGVSVTSFGGYTCMNISGGAWSWHNIARASAGVDVSGVTYFEYEIYFDSTSSGDQVEWSVTAPDGQEWNSTYQWTSPIAIDGQPASYPYTMSQNTWHTVRFDGSGKTWWATACAAMRYVKWQLPEASTAYIRKTKFYSEGGEDTTPPTPDPMTFATAPYAAGTTSIAMVATTASDENGVEYYFDCTAGGGHDSGWQDSTSYTDTGLAELTQYTYCVRARDKSSNQNATAWSSGQSATTEDGTAPTPDPMTFATVPYAAGPTSISMVASTASDPSGVQYYFECTAGGGHNSGWQASASYTDTGLSELTQYTYRVRARDLSANNNQTGWSTTQSATTEDGTAPTPNPSTWATLPYATGSTSISMTATTASDPSGVQYYFDCTAGAGGHDSGWQSGATYQDTGLSASTQYSYRVQTRDQSANLNTGTWSTTQSATTQAPPDTTAPTPDPLTWATVPYAAGPTSISMVATTASDPSGVEYYFDCTAGGGHDSGWQDSTSYTDTGLAELTQHTYRVQARDKSANQNTGGWSTSLAATTEDGTAPTPNPSTWATMPYATGSSSISMTATTASDPSGVQYFFDCTTTGGHDSAWQSSSTYEDTGLSPSTQYTYRVRTRDQSTNLNTGTWSTSQSATTDPLGVSYTIFNGGFQDNWAAGSGVTVTSFGGYTCMNISGDAWSWHNIARASAGASVTGAAYFEYEIYFDSASSGDRVEWHVTAPDGQEWNGTYQWYSPLSIDGVPDTTPYEMSQNTWHTVCLDGSGKTWWSTACADLRYVKWQLPEASTAYIRKVRFYGGEDTTPPTPDPMTFATNPYATGTTSIAMVATTASDDSGVEYYFDCTAGGGHDSGWQDGTSYEDTGLSPGTQYTYRVQARDKSANQNATAWSSGQSATTNSPSWTQLTYDDFESGFGNYTDGGGDCSRYTGGTYAHQGSCAIDIQDNSGVASSFYHTNGINVTSYSQIKVEFWYYPVSMDNSSEDFWVQYYDGSNWHTVRAYARTTDFENNNFYQVKDSDIIIDSGSYNFPTNMKIRFMCDASGNQDDVYIDEVKVSAQ